MVRRSSLLLACFMSVVIGCGAPDAAHYEGVIDALTLPDEWEMARSVVYAPEGDVACSPSPVTDCPYVVRYYLEPGLPRDIYEAARSAVGQAGFAIDRDSEPDCEPSEVPCGFIALRGADQVNVAIYQPGEDDGTGVARPDHVTVRITAQEKD